jgi:hypothetical protein
MKPAAASAPADFRAYQLQFARHLRAPEVEAPPAGVAAKRMQVYAELVFNNLESTLAACYPVCKKVLGLRRWRSLLRQFMAQHRCRTPLFRQIPEEFLHYLEAAGAHALRLPPYLYCLAHYEWIELALALAEVEDEAVAQGDLMTGVPALVAALALLSYPYPVHRISPRCKPAQAFPAPVHLLVFRDAAGVVHFIELNDVSARLLQLLQLATLRGAEALQRLADEWPQLERAAVLRHGRELLHELSRQGAIAGVRPIP